MNDPLLCAQPDISYARCVDQITGQRVDLMTGQPTSAASSSPQPDPSGLTGAPQDPVATPIWEPADAGPHAPHNASLAHVPVRAPSGPSRRARIGHLSADPRMPGWRRRMLIAVPSGILAGVLFGWRFGLTVAVLIVIADIVVRSRTSATVPAGTMATVAQRRTKRYLARLERAGFRTLNARAIPGTDQVIDHFVVGPTGVYSIDSEQWDKRLPVRTKNARQLWHGPESQKHRLEHARWEAAQASELVGSALGMQLTVRPAMVVYGPAIPWGVATIRDVDVFGGKGLRKYLRRHPAGRRAPRLDPGEVERIRNAADSALPPVT